MNFSSDAIADIEGLLEVNQDFCKHEAGLCPASRLKCLHFDRCSQHRDLFSVLAEHADGGKGIVNVAAE